jgi:endonuclease YncB( thermonuclease family)
MLALLVFVTAFEFTEVQVHYVYDGDTMMVSLPGLPPVFGDHISVRIRGIDAPEIKARCEREKRLSHNARDLVRIMVEHAEHITLKRLGRDKYFRLLADVVIDGHDVGSVLVEQGLAVRYDGGTKAANWCAIKEG